MKELHISTGSISLNIVRDNEAVGVFKFNPKDIGEAQRYSDVAFEMESKKTEYIAKAKELDKNNDVKGKIEFLANFVLELRNDVDKIYGVGTSQLVFGDALDIDMFFQFINSLAPYYKKASEERTQKYKNNK